jgi:methyl-accepting chemotaxis protein
VGLNIGVESSRSAESKEMFKFDVQAIKQSALKISRIVEKIRDDSKGTRIRLIQAHEEISDGLEHLLKLADDAEQAVQYSLGKIERLMGDSLDAMGQIGARTRKISQQVSEIVVGIQFHDSMRQRIEHMIKSFQDIASLCADGASTPESNSDKTERFSSAYSILDIQVAQLNQVISEVDAVYERNVQAFGGIGEEVNALAQTLSGLGSDNTEAGKGREVEAEDGFSELNSHLDHLRRLLGQGRSLVNQISGTAAQASETAGMLSDHAKNVRSLSFEIHILAINAILNALRLGDKGATLEVLAEEVKGLSNQSEAFVSQVDDLLASISSTAQELEAGPQGKAGAKEAGSSVRVSMEEGIEAVSRSYDQFSKYSSEAFERAGALKAAISHTSGGLEFLNELAGRLKGHLGELEEITADLSPWASRDSEYLTDNADKLAKRYTMQQEREVHEQVIKCTSDSKDPGAEDLEYAGDQKDSGAEDDDLGDNVELF